METEYTINWPTSVHVEPSKMGALEETHTPFKMGQLGWPLRARGFRLCPGLGGAGSNSWSLQKTFKCLPD